MNQVAIHPTVRLEALKADTFEGLTQQMAAHGVEPGSWRIVRAPIRIGGAWRCCIAAEGERDPAEDQRLAGLVLAKGDK